MPNKAAEPIPSLFSIPFGTNVGYAIADLESVFYRLGLELALGNESCVHFAYRGFERGHPTSLPANFSNLIEANLSEAQSPEEMKAMIQGMAKYVRQNRIKFILFFDIQPIHPVFRALRKAGVLTIISYWGAPISSVMPLWKRLLKRLQLAFSTSRLDGLIFESQAMAQLARQGRGVPKGMIDVVPLGIDQSKYISDPSNYVYKVFPFSPSRRVIIYCGHMESRKGVRVLIEAAIELLLHRKRQDACFLLCGNKETESLEYEKLYDGMGIETLIKFGGYRADLAKIYPSCFCGVIPSSGWDSFPRTSLEIASAGLPIIGSRLGGLPEAILDGKTGLLFEPGNAFQLADKIEFLLDNPQVARTLGRQGQERCANELTMQKQFEGLFRASRRHLPLQQELV
jgi:glycosyltransferase involved in cell wall biosynthesis